jgi:23S rRNA pseudouridine2605 synthase
MKKKVNRVHHNNKTISYTAKQPEIIRLNKYIAEAGICSRRKADELISQGSVKVNKVIVTELGTKIKKTDIVTINGNTVKSYQKKIYIILNKPKDCITTTSDEKQRRTVLDIVRTRAKLFPVGRLDRNTTGVLLLTNDGELTFRLTHPKFGVERTYIVNLDKKITMEDAKKIAGGIETEDFISEPCELFIYPDDKTNLIITLREGKNREVKKLFELCGYLVKKLDRKYFAGLSTRGLNRSEYRHLTKQEVQMLKKSVNLDVD